MQLILQCFFMFAYVGGSSFKKPLTAQEERELLQQLAQGDSSARDTLIEHNMRLVAHIVKKYAANGREAEELISVGTIGLIKAINTFNAQKGRLATYGARCVENEVLMYLRSCKKHRLDISLQEGIGVDKEGNRVTLEEKLAYEGDTVEEVAEKKAELISLRQRLNVLSPRERKIIELRYGLKTGEEVTQREIAKLLNISRSYVSRIEKRAIEKLRLAMKQ